MAQRLIVEGNDAIVLAVLCQKWGLLPPVGYESEIKFKNEFVKNSGGYTKALFILEQSLADSNLTNIGIIVDANDAGPLARWQAIRGILAKKYTEASLLQADQMQGAKIVLEEKMATVGVWIMPDNVRNGYLEHFLADLVPEKDALWAHSVEVIDNLQKQSFCELTLPKMGKATLHTWLAWKKEPGKPFGQALESRYFDANAPSVEPYLAWFSTTFDLGIAG
ncbi:MAG: DUF3226 domain-containing protein [Saprospiraceae bacterium]